MNIAKQQALLKIVQTWNLSKDPEYRRFRCANCQTHMLGAVFHHLLNLGGFICPVHLCRNCQAQFNTGVIASQNPPAKIDRPIFNFLPENVAGIVESWNKEQDGPILKEISCDYCNKPLEKDNEGYPEGFHIWWKNNDNLVEVHFDKSCAEKFGIKN